MRDIPESRCVAAFIKFLRRDEAGSPNLGNPSWFRFIAGQQVHSCGAFLSSDILRRSAAPPAVRATRRRANGCGLSMKRGTRTPTATVDQCVLRYGNRRISWLSHLIVADLVFWQCVLWHLFERRLVGTGTRRLAPRFSKFCWQTCADAFVKHVARSNLGFANYQEALGGYQHNRDAFHSRLSSSTCSASGTGLPTSALEFS